MPVYSVRHEVPIWHTRWQATIRHRFHARVTVALSSPDDAPSSADEAFNQLRSFNHHVAHEMVSCVSAFSHLATLCQLAARKGDPQALEAWLSTMQVHAATAVSLVSSLVVLAESDQPLAGAKRVSLSRCAFAALEELAHTRGPISSRVTVNALPDVLGDECLLTRVFVNLIGNALKFSARAAEPRVVVASILALVRAGHGHAVLTASAVAVSGSPADFIVRPLTEPPLTSTLCLAISAQRPATPLVKYVARMLSELVTSGLAAAHNVYDSCYPPQPLGRRRHSDQDALPPVNEGDPMRPLSKALCSLAGIVALALAAPLHAQEFPTKPVRILTPFPVGGGPEAVLRMLAEKLQRQWGKPVIVENRPGGNGFIAIQAFKHGATDGHDLIQLDNVHLSAYPHLFKKLPYDAQKDFDPLLPLFRTYFFVTVPTGSPYKTVGDLVADAKARPGALNYGSWSVGNTVHLGSALLESLTGTQMQHVIYKETSQLYTGVANGELNFALGSLATAGPLQRAGRLRFLAVTAPKRHTAFPDVPTVTESGGPAQYEVTGWTAIAAPKGLPKAVADKIQNDIAQALAEADVKDRYAAFGYEPFPQTREQFNAFIQSESARYADVIRRAKVSID